jgi:hypothetical protein
MLISDSFINIIKVSVKTGEIQMLPLASYAMSPVPLPAPVLQVLIVMPHKRLLPVV